MYQRRTVERCCNASIGLGVLTKEEVIIITTNVPLQKKNICLSFDLLPRDWRCKTNYQDIYLGKNFFLG